MNDRYDGQGPHEGQEAANPNGEYHSAHSPGMHEGGPSTNPGEVRDQQLLAAVEAAIAARGAPADAPAASRDLTHFSPGEAARGEIPPIGAFSARLAATLPRMDERFHDELFATLMRELSEPESGEAQEPEPEVASQASTLAPRIGTVQPQRPPRSERPFPWPAPLTGLISRLGSMRASGPQTQAASGGNKGRVASAVTALAGVAVVLLVLVTMTGMLKLRQDSNQSNKNAQASLTQTATARGSSNTLQVVADLQPLYTLTATGSIAWSPGSQNLMTSGRGYGDMQMWDAATGSLLHSVKTGEGDNRVWAPDPRMLALVSGRTVKLLDLTSGQESQSWSAPEEIGTLAWSPDGQTLATGAANSKGVVRIWDVATGRETLSFSYPVTLYSAYTPALAWSPDGHTLAVGGGLTAAELWDPGSGKLVRSIGPDYQNTTRALLALTPSPTPLPTPAYRDVGGVGPPGLAWSPDGRYIATSYARIVTVWDVASGKQLRTMGAPVAYDNYTFTWDSLGWVWGLSWSHDGSVLAVANGELTLWDAATGNLLRTLPGMEPVGAQGSQGSSATGAAGLALQPVWSPGGRKLAVAYADKIGIWGVPGDMPASATPSSTTPASATPSSTQTPGMTPSPAPLASAPKCGRTWRLVPVPTSGAAGTNQGPFTGVAAISADDVWAVGYDGTTSSNTLAAHWDGSGWSMITTPNIGTGDNKLHGVAALHSNDVWAVGSYNTSPSDSEPLIVHWDGGVWKVVPNPDPGPGYASLHAVVTISSNDVWAVGSYSTKGDPGNAASKSRTLIEHWDGTRWSIISSPSPGSASNTLSAIAAVSSNDIWAVGSYEQVQKEFVGVGKTLALHWNGTSWRQVPSPDVQTWIDGLAGVAVRSTDDVWAVGWINGGEHVDPLTMHWDGKQWSIVPSPKSTSHNGGSLGAVTILSATDVWAVGEDWPEPSAMHWDGGKWEGISWSSQGVDGSYPFGGLYGIAAVSSTDIWAVGGMHGNGVSGNATTAFVMRYSNVPCVTPSPATPTTSPATPAQTAAPSTSSTAQTLAAVPSPRPVCRTWNLVANVDVGARLSSIASVAAASPDDIWAVGAVASAGSQIFNQTLIVHWDGTSWSRVPSPNVPGAALTTLATVGAVSKRDVWAVGNYLAADKDTGKTLAMHWDGNGWSIVPTPSSSAGRYNFLTGLAAISANDVWAVGDYGDDQQGRFGNATFIIHWDGNKWSEVRSPNVGQFVNVLTSVTFTSKDDAWAVGFYSNSIPTYATLILHWDGAAWSVVPSPNIPHPTPGLTANKLEEVVALGKGPEPAKDVWSLGHYDAPTSGPSYTFTMLQRWDGARWNILVPGTRSIGAPLTSLAALAPNDIWALGPALAVAHWDGSTWSELRKPDWYGLATGIEKALALPSGEILTLGIGSDGHVLIGNLIADGRPCNTSEIRLVAPPTPTFPPPVPTAAP